RLGKTISMGPNAELLVLWSPLQGNVINATLLIAIPLPIPLVQIYLGVGFNIGVNPTQVIGDIEYEEEAKGFFHLDDEPFGIVDLDEAKLGDLALEDRSHL